MIRSHVLQRLENDRIGIWGNRSASRRCTDGQTDLRRQTQTQTASDHHHQHTHLDTLARYARGIAEFHLLDLPLLSKYTGLLTYEPGSIRILSKNYIFWTSTVTEFVYSHIHSLFSGSACCESSSAWILDWNSGVLLRVVCTTVWKWPPSRTFWELVYITI